MAYLCVECCKLFTTQNNLKRHAKTVHDNEKNYLCEICAKVFGRKDMLDRHIKVLHNKVKTHVCDACNKVFGYSWRLKSHVENIHINPKPKSMSRLEQRVAEIVTSYGITFMREKTFDDLTGLNNGYLRYDFAIETSNDSTPLLLIEVDGRQHEQPVNFAGMSDDKSLEKC